MKIRISSQKESAKYRSTKIQLDDHVRIDETEKTVTFSRPSGTRGAAKTINLDSGENCFRFAKQMPNSDEIAAFVAALYGFTAEYIDGNGSYSIYKLKKC